MNFETGVDSVSPHSRETIPYHTDDRWRAHEIQSRNFKPFAQCLYKSMASTLKLHPLLRLTLLLHFRAITSKKKSIPHADSFHSVAEHT
jgi:hypothetical protein